ncbi:MAG: helix-turn-helix transcriptional regulator [Saprospiraceae bacterium]|nr:helix-turn-helix transcriptional regulator [Saprospiraceae bacterium]MCB0682904.1 helix-turn-helix transcriptional regulator [Saprospiraceae bacterium]
MSTIPGNYIPIRQFDHGHLLQREALNYDSMIIHSRLREFQKQVPDSGLSIKLAVAGQEHYEIGSRSYTVSPEQYLVVNRHQSFECHFQSREIVEAFCLYIGPDIVQEVQAHLQAPEILQTDEAEASPGGELRFFENTFRLGDNPLGLFLEKLRYRLLHHAPPSGQLPEAAFFRLSELLIRHQSQVARQIDRLPSAKPATREELFRRLSIAHSYIHDHYRDPIQLEQVSRAAAVSKFHLLRTFKTVYGITPYQLVLQLRLQAAKTMLGQDRKLEEIAFDLGFSDRRAFTKAYKKAFGRPPAFARATAGQRPPSLSHGETKS